MVIIRGAIGIQRNVGSAGVVNRDITQPPRRLRQANGHPTCAVGALQRHVSPRVHRHVVQGVERVVQGDITGGRGTQRRAAPQYATQCDAPARACADRSADRRAHVDARIRLDKRQILDGCRRITRRAGHRQAGVGRVVVQIRADRGERGIDCHRPELALAPVQRNVPCTGEGTGRCSPRQIKPALAAVPNRASRDDHQFAAQLRRTMVIIRGAIGVQRHVGRARVVNRHIAQAPRRLRQPDGDPARAVGALQRYVAPRVHRYAT